MKQISLTPNIKSQLFTSLAACPTAFIFGDGVAYINNVNYTITRTSSNGAWNSIGSSLLMTNRPTAAALGIGTWAIGATIYSSDGSVYVPLNDSLTNFSNAVYDSVTKLLMSATIDSIPYTFTYYSNNLIETIVGNGITQTFGWTNGNLTSVITI